MDKASSRRLDALQQIVDRGRPCEVVVTFRDGSSSTTDPANAWDIVRDQGQDIVSVKVNRPEYQAAAAIMGVVAHPVPNREVRDFE